MQAKKQGRHRSARWVQDHLKLRVHEKTVWRLFVKHGLHRLTLPPIKPITRFQARRANDFWQTYLSGRFRFPKIGSCHLILLKDDRSRYLLAGSWVQRPRKIAVFACLYRAFMHYGLPKAILCDRGSQDHVGRSAGPLRLRGGRGPPGIRVSSGHRLQAKSKTERRFEFIRRDFVSKHLHEATLEALNRAWTCWLQRVHVGFHSRVVGGHTPSHYYHLSPRRRCKAELQVLLLHEDRLGSSLIPPLTTTAIAG